MKLKFIINERKSLEEFLKNDNSLHDSFHNFVRDIGQTPHEIHAKTTEDSFKYGFIEIEKPVDMEVLSKVASKNGLICEIVG